MHRGENTGKFEERLKLVKPNDIISFTYTSGTTGNPKAGMFNSQNVITVAKNLPECYLLIGQIWEFPIYHYRI
ncbi:MAG: hypothetical protein CM1200mP10_05120 [Candidatus Neomarinimicrobiota bacterium]|nr:MAG: hypothetical protein CM1200mP10_05120 [Candidatus Neomarinimicrobiota bacterium]